MYVMHDYSMSPHASLTMLTNHILREIRAVRFNLTSCPEVPMVKASNRTPWQERPNTSTLVILKINKLYVECKQIGLALSQRGNPPCAELRIRMSHVFHIIRRACWWVSFKLSVMLRFGRRLIKSVIVSKQRPGTNARTTWSGLSPVKVRVTTSGRSMLWIIVIRSAVRHWAL